MLIVLSGMSGTGKSTLASGIAASRRAAVVSVDPIESAIIRTGIEAGFETGLAAYLVAETVADQGLATGIDVVVDAVNSIDEARDMWRGLAGKHAVHMAVIECVISDLRTHAARVAARDRGLALAEPTWRDVERRKTEWIPWPEPHLAVDAMDDPDTNLQKALAYIESVAGGAEV